MTDDPQRPPDALPPQPLRDAEPARPPRDPETRRRDHAQIDRLADDVLPDLISRLAASGLGEIEVREDDWRIRLRRPTPPRGDRGHERAADRSSRSGVPASATAEPRGPRDGRDGPGTADTATPAAGPHRVIATSPAVGVFQPRADVRPGSRVRAGDRIAAVDLLGVPQDVVAPEDGVVVDSLVEAGEGVEYGQDLVVIEVAARGRPGAEPGTWAAAMAES